MFSDSAGWSLLPAAEARSLDGVIQSYFAGGSVAELDRRFLGQARREPTLRINLSPTRLSRPPLLPPLASVEWNRPVWQWLIAILAVPFGAVGVAILLVNVTGWPSKDCFLIVAGALCICGGLLKPWWFWQHDQVRAMRRSIGDLPASIIYSVLGVVLVGLGLFTHVMP